MGRRQKIDVDSLNVINDDHRCENCDLFVRNLYIPTGEGYRRSPVLFLNDITSTSDVNNNAHFTGRRSIIIRKLVSLYNLSNFVDYRNLICCQSVEFNKYIYSKCKDNLIRFIKYNKPTIIVTLGRNTYSAFTGDYDNYNRNLYKIISFNAFIVIPIEHPHKVKIDKSYTKYIKAFNMISKVYSVINSNYIPIRYDTSDDLGL